MKISRFLYAIMQFAYARGMIDAKHVLQLFFFFLISNKSFIKGQPRYTRCIQRDCQNNQKEQWSINSMMELIENKSKLKTQSYKVWKNKS